MFDDLGRITGCHDRHGGGTPRFVLGRAREGVVWRFRSGLDPGLVVEIGRLAAREQGFPIDGERAQAPERLAEIAKRIDRHDRTHAAEGHSPQILALEDEARRTPDAPAVRHHWVSHGANVVGEFWTID